MVVRIISGICLLCAGLAVRPARAEKDAALQPQRISGAKVIVQ